MYFETSYLGENIEKRYNQKVAQNVDNSLGYTIFLKSSPTGEKSPNLVTLPPGANVIKLFTMVIYPHLMVLLPSCVIKKLLRQIP
jgi:hypothetical protein